MEVFLRHPKPAPSYSRIGKTDLLVAVPSYNHARTIGDVLQKIREGLERYFPEHKAVILNPDGGSTDDTRREAAAQDTPAIPVLSVHYEVDLLDKLSAGSQEIPRRDHAFGAIREAAAALQAKACAIVDPNLLGISPEWIFRLLEPVVQGLYDFAAPYYHRHPYDGTITNCIVYPLVRSLYGQRIRFPMGNDFGFSGAAAELLETTEPETADFGRQNMELRLTVAAMVRKYRICQVYLGTRTHHSRGGTANLSSLLARTTGSVFGMMEENPGVWKEIKSSKAVPLLNFREDPPLPPTPVNVEGMYRAFNLGVKEFLPLWREVLSTQSLDALREMHLGPEQRFPDELWARVVYEFAIAFHDKAMTREHLLKSLTPLYLGKVSSLVLENRSSEQKQMETRIERLCQVFEREKNHLISRWS
jgi:hypothetical protein